MVVSDNHCFVHGWWLEDGELCPVCEGILLERERVVELLKTVRVGDEWIGRDYVIELIEGGE